MTAATSIPLEALLSWRDRITVDPKVLVEKPVIKGTRIAVKFLMELLAEGWTHEQILGNYPDLTSDDIQAALHLETIRKRSGCSCGQMVCSA